MNVDTGEIKYFDTNEALAEALKSEKWVEVDESEMTKKQKKEKKVSLNDHRSILGKKLTKNRKRRLKRKGLLK